jgi:hypothetical protein
MVSTYFLGYFSLFVHHTPEGVTESIQCKRSKNAFISHKYANILSKTKTFRQKSRKISLEKFRSLDKGNDIFKFPLFFPSIFSYLCPRKSDLGIITSFHSAMIRPTRSAKPLFEKTGMLRIPENENRS